MTELTGLGWLGGWTTPGQVTANTVIVTGPNGGEFVYDNSNHLRSANVGATAADPVQGITCFQGFSTFNGFGAYLSLLSTSASAPGFFEYLDTNSASQGVLAYSFAARAVTEPVTSVAVPQGAQIWNGVLGFLTPVAHPGSIGVAGAGTFTGFMQFLNSAGYRFDAGIVAASIAPPNPLAAGAEVWHAITLDAGWTVTTNFRVKLLTEDNCAWIQGDATHAAFTGATSMNSGSPLNAAYQPASSAAPASPLFPAGRCGVTISAAGVITAQPLGVSCTQVNVNGIYPLD
jgi:hypothetical protein